MHCARLTVLQCNAPSCTPASTLDSSDTALLVPADGIAASMHQYYDNIGRIGFVRCSVCMEGHALPLLDGQCCCLHEM